MHTSQLGWGSGIVLIIQIKKDMMTQEEIDAILGEDSGSSVTVEIVSPTEEPDASMEGDVFDIVKDVHSAIRYLNYKKLCLDILQEYGAAPHNSYSQKLAAYRIVVAALTSNEKRHLTTGERWYPVVQFCKPGKEKNCRGSKVIGTIESEGEKYTVVGGNASYGAVAGLGYFDSYNGVSYSYTHVGFQSVSSERVAKHISEYFGRLLFDIHYGGTNCDWKWLS